MARIRTIKPEFWQDEKLSPCDPLTRLVFLGLVSLADDAGRLVDNLRLIDAQIFPNTADTAHEALMRLSRMGRIRRGKTASGQRIIELTNWNRHQKIQHPNLRGALPEIVEDEAVADAHEALMSHSRAAPEPLTHHTNDQRPEPTTRTNDHMPPDPRVGRPDAVASAARTGGEPMGHRLPDGSPSDQPSLDSPDVVDDEDTDQRPPAAAVHVASTGVAIVPRGKAKPRKRSGATAASKETSEEPAVLTKLLELWATHIKPFATRQERDRVVVQFLAFLKTPESERPKTYPNDQQLLFVVAQLVQLIGRDPELKSYRNPEFFAGTIIGATASFREFFDNPYTSHQLAAAEAALVEQWKLDRRDAARIQKAAS